MEDARGGMPFWVTESQQVQLRDNVIRAYSGSTHNMARFSNNKYLLLEGNAISRAGHSPLQFYPVRSNQYVVVRGNVIHGGWGRAFEFFGDRDVLFEGNIVTNSFNGGRSGSAGINFYLDGGIFRFNRVFRNWGGVFYSGPWLDDLYLRSVRFYNNVFDHNFGPAMTVTTDGKKLYDLGYVNNIFYRNDPHGGHRQMTLNISSPEHIFFSNNIVTFMAQEQKRSVLQRILDGIDDIFMDSGDKKRNDLKIEPGFVDLDNYDHGLSPESQGRNSGRHLTAAVGLGNSNVLPVKDALYFYDGFGIVGEVGDLIAVGSGDNTARIVSIDRDKNQLVLDRVVTWKDGDPVGLPWVGEAPDLGVYEYGEGARPSVQVQVMPFLSRPGEEVTIRAILHGIEEPVSAVWHLGDGTIAEGLELVHIYHEASDYPIRIRVTDAGGYTYMGTGYAVAEKQRNSKINNPFGRALRVSVAGSSITWGSGWLGEGSYVGGIEDFLRNVLATTIHAMELDVRGDASTIRNPLFYRGNAKKLQGVGAAASFVLEGDELSISIGRERGNEGAAQIELYVDGMLYDTFTTYNPELYEEGKEAIFTGNGLSRIFDLGEAFTFEHVVTIDGVPKIGGMNTLPYGGTPPAEWDYIIIRKLAMINGKPSVTHHIRFANAPDKGGKISVIYSVGESITHVRSTVGQIGKKLTDANESPYGDGKVNYDPANPSSLSSGLGFRESDPRAVLTWNFTESKSRRFEIRIRGLDPRAKGDVPELILNFATNRMHHIQNAGIGGWTAQRLLTDSGLNNVGFVQSFSPDIFLLESCTNDDHSEHMDKAWRKRTGLTDAEVRNVESANYFHTVTYISPDNYRVEDIRIIIKAITPNSAVLDGTDATFSIEVGDVLIIGDFKGDNRRVACRIVKTWDPITHTVTWTEPLRISDIAYIKRLDDLVGGYLVVKSSPGWSNAVQGCIDAVRKSNPDCQIILGTSGIPNQHHRRLEGYRELAREICLQNGGFFADFYGRTLEWQYSQAQTNQLYINSTRSTIATGDTEYTLFRGNGSKPDPSSNISYWLLRNFSVKVNGVERLNDNCYITGGRKVGWSSSTLRMSKMNTSYVSAEYKLVFTADIPKAGDEIIVTYTPKKWADDDTHPSPYGRELLAQAATAALLPILEKDLLMHTTFDVDDEEWWWRWQTYRPTPTSWDREVFSKTGTGVLNIFAPAPQEGIGTIPAWTFPVVWDIDKYPIIKVRYKVAPGPETPVGLWIGAFPDEEGKSRRLYVALSPSVTPAPNNRIGSAVLIDDGKWHELTIDARMIRERYPDIKVLEGMGFDSAGHTPAYFKGPVYSLDEVIIEGTALL